MAYSADLLQVVKVEKCSKIDRFSCSPQTQSLLEDEAPAANVIGDTPGNDLLVVFTPFSNISFLAGELAETMDRVLEGCHGQVCFATNLKCEIWKKHIRTIYSSSNHVYSHQLTLSKSSKSKKNPWSCGLEIFKMNMASSSCNIGPTPKRGKELLQSGCVA